MTYLHDTTALEAAATLQARLSFDLMMTHLTKPPLASEGYNLSQTALDGQYWLLLCRY